MEHKDEYHQCDQIGQFLNFLGTKLLTKVAQIISNFFSYLKLI